MRMSKPHTTAANTLRLYITRLCYLSAIPLILSFLMTTSTSSVPYFPHPLDQQIYPGDRFIVEPSMLYNQHITIANSTANDIFPWLLQLGKGRAGWYLPATWDTFISIFISRKWKGEHGGMAAWEVRQDWVEQAMTVGNRVEDYGFGEEPEWFEVVEIKQPSSSTTGEKDRNNGWLVYRSERYGCEFTWALLVWEHPLEDDSNQAEPGTPTNQPQHAVAATRYCTVHLRFRGRIQATGMKKRLIVWGGGLMDHWTTSPMLRGLRERIEATKMQNQGSSNTNS